MQWDFDDWSHQAPESLESVGSGSGRGARVVVFCGGGDAKCVDKAPEAGVGRWGEFFLGVWLACGMPESKALGSYMIYGIYHVEPGCMIQAPAESIGGASISRMPESSWSDKCMFLVANSLTPSFGIRILVA